MFSSFPAGKPRPVGGELQSQDNAYFYHSFFPQTITGRIGPGKRPPNGIPWGVLKKMVDRHCPDRLKVQPVRKIMYIYHSVGRYFAGFSFFGFFREVCP